MPPRQKENRKVERSDWTRLRSLSDRDIEEIAATDPDNPGTAVADWAEATISLPPLKVPVNAKFDADIVAWFKSKGRGYQTRMNAVLRQYMERHGKAG